MSSHLGGESTARNAPYSSTNSRGHLSEAVPLHLHDHRHFPLQVPSSILPSSQQQRRLFESDFPSDAGLLEPANEESFSDDSDDLFDFHSSGTPRYPPFSHNPHMSNFSSFNSSLNSPRTAAPAPIPIDLTQDSSPYTMTPARGTKRRRSVVEADSHEPSPSNPAKRRRRSSNNKSPVKLNFIEQIDLSAEDDEVASTLQKQRADQVRSQQEPLPVGRSKLTSLQCTVCLEPPTDLTSTSCGHVFCRTCLMDWLVSAEKDPIRRANCPACRKHINARINQRNRKDVVPLVFMRKPTG